MDHVALRVDKEADHVKNRTSETERREILARGFVCRLRAAVTRRCMHGEERPRGGGVPWCIPWQDRGRFGEVRCGRAGGMIPFIAVYLCFTTRPRSPAAAAPAPAVPCRPTFIRIMVHHILVGRMINVPTHATGPPPTWHRLSGCVRRSQRFGTRL